MRSAAAFALVLFALPAASGCHGHRPLECQMLRQCCDVARSTNSEVETVRVQCTRKDDDDAVLCKRRLDDVVGALPSLEGDEACRIPPQSP
jgi:hypothetical protein